MFCVFSEHDIVKKSESSGSVQNRLSGIILIIIAPRLLPFGGRPAVGIGPKLEEMNPRTFPDLPIRPRTLKFDQKTRKLPPKNPTKKSKKSKNPLLPYILANNSYPTSK